MQKGKQAIEIWQKALKITNIALPNSDLDRTIVVLGRRVSRQHIYGPIFQVF